MIRLELAPSVSEASLRTVTDAQGLSVTIPDELTNEITTNVRVRDGNTLVLGGLFRESNRITRRQIPFLGDIPVLGYAFRGQDDSVERNEIIFLITPSIVHDEALWAMGGSTLAYTDEVRIGASIRPCTTRITRCVSTRASRK
jgi:type II secretory pathway component GspD/PulD (secretin)